MSILNRVVVSSVIAVTWCCTMSEAVIIKGGDGRGNTDVGSISGVFSDFPFFDHVGFQGSGSGVYLGNHWVLTAYHINGTGEPSGVRLQNVFYRRDANTPTIQLVNPDNSLADLRLFRIENAPTDLPVITIGSGVTEIGTDVVMIGAGRDRQADLSAWDVNEVEEAWIWDPVDPLSSLADQEGYHWDELSSARSVRWGVNTVTDNYLENPDELIYSSGHNGQFGKIFAFATTFDSDGTDSEALAAAGDSGGAVFAKNGDVWELIGSINAISALHGQPGATAIFSNETQAVDLSPFRNQILTVVIPEPSTFVILMMSGVLLRRRRG